jgi:hypothetical protein
MIYAVLAILVVAVVGFGVLWAAINRKQALSETVKNKIRAMWSNVELLMSRDDEASWMKAVFEADKILEYTLAAKNIPGTNLGERLKNGKGSFSNVQSAWEAHKLRNQLAHEIDTRLAHHEADRAIKLFKDSLRQLGAGI